MPGKLCGRSGAMLVPALWIYYYSIITGNIITPPTIGLFISYFIRGITLVRRDNNHFPTTQERLRSQSGNKEGTAYPFPRIRTHQKLQRKKSPSRDTSIAAASPSERFRSHRWMLPPVLPGWLHRFTRCSATGSGSELMLPIQFPTTDRIFSR